MEDWVTAAALLGLLGGFAVLGYRWVLRETKPERVAVPRFPGHADAAAPPPPTSVPDEPATVDASAAIVTSPGLRGS